tara:strand:+ start:2959 stop:3147 length:189 start_codon:yes stop_codon:yes gene_type:complete
MTDTTKTDSIFSRQTRPSQGAQAVAISSKEYGYIRLLAAISGEPEEVLLADFLANKAERRQF